MRLSKIFLLIGGIFNGVMGFIFFSPQLLSLFFTWSMTAEQVLFGRSALLPYPTIPIHLLLIHGFGAAAMILGATLMAATRDPVRFLPFIFFDALGRLLFGSLMLLYIVRFALMRFLLIFAGLELLLAVAYLIITWKYSE